MVMSKGIRRRGRPQRRGEVGPRVVQLSGSPPAAPPCALTRLARYLLPLWPKLLAGVLCLVVVSLLSLYYGILGKHLIDAITPDPPRVQVQVERLDRYALLAVAVFLTKGLFAFGQIYLMSNVAQR